MYNLVLNILFESSPKPEISSIFEENIVLKSCFRAYFLFALTHVANQRQKISRDRKYSKLIGCSVACVHFFICENKENVLTEIILSDFNS